MKVLMQKGNTTTKRIKQYGYHLLVVVCWFKWTRRWICKQANKATKWTNDCSYHHHGKKQQTFSIQQGTNICILHL